MPPRRTPSLDEQVKEAYTTPGHPIAFSAPSTVASYFGTSRNQARRILEHVDGYTLHRDFKRPRKY